MPAMFLRGNLLDVDSNRLERGGGLECLAGLVAGEQADEVTAELFLTFGRILEGVFNFYVCVCVKNSTFFIGDRTRCSDFLE